MSVYPIPSLQKIYEDRNAPVDLVRRSIEERIEQLIYLLDCVDDDPDLEASGDDEPSLGWNGNGPKRQEESADLEFDPCDDEDMHDSESGDAGDYDPPGFIWGGNESGGPAHSGA